MGGLTSEIMYYSMVLWLIVINVGFTIAGREILTILLTQKIILCLLDVIGIPVTQI